MSREHKYRAWDKEANCMIGWDHLCDMMETGKIELLERRSLRRDWPEATIKKFSRTGNPFKNPCFDLMQYTGLKDKGGKEICEGDIVKVPATILPKGESGCIQNEGLQVVNWDITEDGLFDENVYAGFCFMVGEHLVKDCEIVGNIHDNPEMLLPASRP